MNVAIPLLHPTPGFNGNEYSERDGRIEMSAEDTIPHGFAVALLAGGAILFFFRRSGFVDVSVRGGGK
jgi:hypothetical protein